MELTMPKFGATMTKGQVSQWIVTEGETFNKDDDLVEITTEKYVNMIQAPVSGVLEKIIVQEGDEAEVGSPIAIIKEC